MYEFGNFLQKEWGKNERKKKFLVVFCFFFFLMHPSNILMLKIYKLSGMTIIGPGVVLQRTRYNVIMLGMHLGGGNIELRWHPSHSVWFRDEDSGLIRPSTDGWSSSISYKFWLIDWLSLGWKTDEEKNLCIQEKDVLNYFSILGKSSGTTGIPCKQNCCHR